jgi:hypothetical protein
MARDELRNRVPLRLRRRQADIAVGRNPLVLQNHLQSAHFLVPKHPMIRVVKQQQAQAVSLKHILRSQMKICLWPEWERGALYKASNTKRKN